jgi:uncharacterized protein YjbJ (UPF0337 family)
MNHDILGGRWKQLKGRLRQGWGALTHNDWAKTKGQRDILMGKLQERYGQTRERLKAGSR